MKFGTENESLSSQIFIDNVGLQFHGNKVTSA